MTGDYLCYLASFPTQADRYFVRDQQNNIIIDYPTLESCTKYLIKHDINIEECIVSKEKVVHKNWEYIATRTLFRKVDEWKRAVGASRAIIALGDNNFRESLPLLYTKYKDRDASKKPLKLKDVRQLVRENFTCESLPMLEADDVISMYQYKGSKKPGTFIVCTEDKDAKQTPGFTFNPRTKEIRDCRGFGEIELKIKESASGSRTYKIDGYGRAFLYYQLICGDSVDTYTPFKPARTAYRFHKDFQGIDNDKDAWQFIVNEYKSYFGDIKEYTIWDGSVKTGTWLDILQTYADAAHMHRWLGDKLDVVTTLNKLGVDY